MKFYVKVEGVDGKTSIPLENLLDKGITPKTWVCIEGTENWDMAENFNELKSLWNPKPKDKNKGISLTKKDEVVPIIQPEKKEINSIQEKSVEENESKIEEENNEKSFPLVIKRVFLIGIVVLVISLVGRWIFKLKSQDDIVSKPIENVITSGTCKEHFDSLLIVGESHIEEINEESLIAFRMLSNYRHCVDTTEVNNIIVSLRNKKNTEKLIMNDPDVKRRDNKLEDAIKLLENLKE